MGRNNTIGGLERQSLMVLAYGLVQWLVFLKLLHCGVCGGLLAGEMLCIILLQGSLHDPQILPCAPSCIDLTVCAIDLCQVFSPMLVMAPLKLLAVLLLLLDVRGSSVRSFFIELHQICDSAPIRSMEVFKFRYTFY